MLPKVTAAGERTPLCTPPPSMSVCQHLPFSFNDQTLNRSLHWDAFLSLCFRIAKRKTYNEIALWVESLFVSQSSDNKGQSVDPTDPTCRCHMLQARAIIGPMCCPDGSSQGFTAGLAGPVELRPRHSCHINCAPIIQLKAHCLAGSMTSAGLAVAASHPSRWQACSLNRGHFVGSELRAVPSLNRLNLSKKDPPTGVSL